MHDEKGVGWIWLVFRDSIGIQSEIRLDHFQKHLDISLSSGIAHECSLPI